MLRPIIVGCALFLLTRSFFFSFATFLIFGGFKVFDKPFYRMIPFAILLYTMVWKWEYVVIFCFLAFFVSSYLHSLTSMTIIRPRDERDRQFLTIAQGSTMSNTTLPSGFVVPKAPEGAIWVVMGEEICLVNK